jgi:hypothetical protein
LICESGYSGCFSIQETLTALNPRNTDFVETLSFGILNNPGWVFETGSRAQMIGKQKYLVKSATGKNWP